MANEMIRFENVHKWFKDLHVINGVNLDIAKGEVVVVCGPSGSGKSTLIRTVNQLETIQDGNIYVDGVGVNDHKTDLNKLRAEVGFVFQSFNLYPHLTAIENIMLSPMKVKKMGAAEAKTLGMSLLKKVGLEHKAESFPGQLSGGQQQRVAIARSLAMEPQVMLFDEVTSALDPQLTGEVLRVIEALAEGGMTMVLVTHEMEFAARVADTIIYMHEGKVWETGPGDMLKNPQTAELRDFLSHGL